MKVVTDIAQQAENFISSGCFVDRITGVVENDPWSQLSLNRCESFSSTTPIFSMTSSDLSIYCF